MRRARRARGCLTWLTTGSPECRGIRGATLPKSRRTISGRTAVISGAASGMGRSLAQRLAAYGSPVAITDIDERGLKETEASISGPVLSRVLDVRDADAQLSFADE